MAPDNQHLIPDGIPGDLRGAKGRVMTGGGIIVLGVLNVVLAIVIIIAASSSIGIAQLVYGIVFLVLSIVAGCFGIFSRQSSCRTITYLVLCVVLAIFTGSGAFETASLAITISAELSGYGYESFDSTYALLLVNIISNALHCVLSIAGASFTCGAVCCVQDQRHIEQAMFVMANPGAIQQPQPTLNAYNVDMRTTVPVSGNPPSYEYPVTVKTTA